MSYYRFQINCVSLTKKKFNLFFNKPIIYVFLIIDCIKLGTVTTHYIGGWVGPRAYQDDVERLKFLTLSALELCSVVQPVASRYTDCATAASIHAV
jgi:hypothetical protein